MRKFNAERLLQKTNKLIKYFKNYLENGVDWNNLSDEDIMVLKSTEKLRDILEEFETKLDEIIENYDD